MGNSLAYFQAHRDGADQVAGAWRRTPAHQADRAATVYADPRYDADGRMIAALEPTGGPVDPTTSPAAPEASVRLTVPAEPT